MRALDTYAVTLFAGHDAPRATPSGAPIWHGTLYQFWRDNPEMTFGEMRDIAGALDDGLPYRIGGGAAQAFTIAAAKER